MAAGGEERAQLLAKALDFNREEVYMIPLFPKLFAAGYQTDLDFTMTPAERWFHVGAIHWDG